MKRKISCCERELAADSRSQGWVEDGELWTCPNCGMTWKHACNGAEGCMWTLFPLPVGKPQEEKP